MFDGVLRGTGGILLESFFKRCLAQATNYRRATGFFSSSVFQAAEQEFELEAEGPAEGEVVGELLCPFGHEVEGDETAG